MPSNIPLEPPEDCYGENGYGGRDIPIPVEEPNLRSENLFLPGIPLGLAALGHEGESDQFVSLHAIGIGCKTAPAWAVVRSLPGEDRVDLAIAHGVLGKAEPAGPLHLPCGSQKSAERSTGQCAPHAYALYSKPGKFRQCQVNSL